jgi:O-antigen/teichoic acid export membrane protein
MSQARRIFESALWNHAGRILEYVLMYLTSVLIARGLGVQENGRFVGLFSLTQLLIVICSFGLETSLNKFIPQLDPEQADEKGRFILRRALFLRVGAFAGVTVLFAAFVRVVSVPFLEENSHILAPVILFTGVRSLVPLFAMVLTARLRTALTAVINLCIRAVELGGVLWLLSAAFDVENLFFLFLGTSILHVAAYAVFSRSTLFGPTHPTEMRPILSFGGLFWINTLVDFVLGRQGDVLLLANLHPDRAQAGLYDVAYSLAQLASMAMTVGLSGVMFATFARLAVDNQEVMDRFYGFSVRAISLLTVPLFAFMIWNADAVLQLLYSPRYNAAAPLVVGILLFRVLSRLFGGPENAEYLLSRGRVGVVVSFGIAAATTNVVLNVLLIPRLGATGAVIAGGCANVLVNMLGALAVYRMSANRLQLSFWLKLLLVSVMAAIAGHALAPDPALPSLIMNGIVFGIVLVLSLLFIKPLTQGDAEWLSRLSRGLGRWLVHFTSPKVVLPT